METIKLDKTVDSRKEHPRAHRQVKEIKGKKIILIPVNLKHWLLVCVDMVNQRIDLYDSNVDGLNVNKGEEIMQDILDQFNDNSMKMWTKNIRPSKDIPTQGNSYDCGLFCIQYAKYLAVGKIIEKDSFVQDEMVNLRNSLVSELLTKKFVYP